MKLAFCLFKYFPYGGLQRDFIRIARICRDRGHEIHVYALHWEGELEPGFHLHLLATEGWQNHQRCQAYVRQLQTELEKTAYDAVIGFNKMPNLDLYYAADVCYQARVAAQRPFWYRLLPRYRQWLALERAVFLPGKQTTILSLSAKQQRDYVDYYQTEITRFHLLPPGIAKDRIATAEAEQVRSTTRAMLNLTDAKLMLLMVGSGFKTKGVDRAIRSLAALPAALRARCQLNVVGQDNPSSFIQLAKRLHVAQQVQFLGGRADVAALMLAADLLLHPAYHENTGTVLLEAVAAGLPVLTLDVCGYAHYVQAAHAGMVLAAPFKQHEWNSAVEKMLLSPEQQQWRQNGLTFAKQADIYRLPEQAATIIEEVGKQRAALY